MVLAKQTAAVIPCLNESAVVGGLVRRARVFVGEAIVVDDGSVDGTAAAAKTAGAVVLSHPRPLGKGASLRAGWAEARRRGFSWAATLDGDGQHCPEEIPKFLAAGNPAPLVIGNRMNDPRGMPRIRRWTNRAMSHFLSRLSGREFPDSQCGFRLVHLESCASLGLRTSHFEIESETLAAFALAGWPVEFVPIRSIYERERSKIRPLIDAWRWARWFARAKREARWLRLERVRSGVANSNGLSCPTLAP